MIIMAILNGSAQIVKYALSIMGCLVFNHFSPLKWSRDKPSLFTRLKELLSHLVCFAFFRFLEEYKIM